MTLLTALVWLVTGAAALATALLVREAFRDQEHRLAALEHELTVALASARKLDADVAGLIEGDRARERLTYALDKDVAELYRRNNLKRYDSDD